MTKRDWLDVMLGWGAGLLLIVAGLLYKLLVLG